MAEEGSRTMRRWGGGRVGARKAFCVDREDMRRKSSDITTPPGPLTAPEKRERKDKQREEL